VLVAADPWFAGTVLFWFLFGAALWLLLLFAAIFLPVKRVRARIVMRPLLSWGLIALLVGLLFAAPWFYGLSRLLTQSGAV
jgi:hypothetical protein